MIRANEFSVVTTCTCSVLMDDQEEARPVFVVLVVDQVGVFKKITSGNIGDLQRFWDIERFLDMDIKGRYLNNKVCYDRTFLAIPGTSNREEANFVLVDIGTGKSVFSLHTKAGDALITLLEAVWPT
jgi:hypothetical protein